MPLPTLTIQRGEGQLEIKDNPALYWEFYCSFIVGGLVALYVTFTSTLSRTSVWIAALVACGAIIGGVFLLTREAASIVVLSRAEAMLTVTRWTLFKRSKSTRSLTNVTAAKVERKDDLDKASLLRPTLVLTDGATLPISNFWYKKDEASRLIVEQVNAYVGAPS
jgi:hypothetical protein